MNLLISQSNTKNKTTMKTSFRYHQFMTMLMAWLVACSPALATTYYVDAQNGNDATSGTSTSNAWKTLTKVNSFTFPAGSEIRFKAGGIWYGQLHPKGSGAAGAVNKIDRYGSGNAPIIDGQGTASKPPVYLYNQQYWEIRNLEIINTDGGSPRRARRGVFILGEDAGQLKHIVLSNLYIHDVNGESDPRGAGGIVFEIREASNRRSGITSSLQTIPSRM